LAGECHAINYDPLVLPRGIGATADPILNARSAAYAESYRRRALEQLRGAFKNLAKGNNHERSRGTLCAIYASDALGGGAAGGFHAGRR
jgi:hypothetical protein